MPKSTTKHKRGGVINAWLNARGRKRSEQNAVRALEKKKSVTKISDSSQSPTRVRVTSKKIPMNGRRAKKGAVREAKEERDKDAMGVVDAK